jgi:predicted dienelactone hydrolase
MLSRDESEHRGMRLKGRIGKTLLWTTAAGVLAITSLFGALSLERRTEITLPAPTGLFAVGRTTAAWIDETHVDALAPVAGAKRELLVWFWYPATVGYSGATDDYVPAQMRDLAGPPSGPMSLITRDFGKVRAHSAPNAQLAASAEPYPVVIMRAGASAGVVGYSTLAEDLASHGYVVVGFDAPYRTNVVVFPDGRVMRREPGNNPEVCAERPLPEQAACMDKLLTAWTEDTSFVVDQLARLNGSNAGMFAGRLDMAKVGVFGHSLGGATAAQFCHDDRRCTAGINIDGQPFGSVVETGLQQPFMFLLSDHGDSTNPVNRAIVSKMQSVYDHLPQDKRHRFAIRGASHFTFSDDGALLKSHIITGALRMTGILGIEGRRQLAVTTYCVRIFFDTYLKASDPSQLTRLSPEYPELVTFH